MVSVEQIRLMSIVRNLEARNAPQELIDEAYDAYWEQVDKDRERARRQDESLYEALHREAIAARKQKGD